MSLARPAVMLAVAAMLLGAALAPSEAQEKLRCGPFNATAAAPALHTDYWAQKSFDRINEEVRTKPYRVLFFGDSITERWQMPLWDAKPVWDANMPQRGVLNAGVSGDRTEHLRWRLDHGNLDGPTPKGVIVLIGTNDLAVGRPPAEAAEGVRQILLRLRDQLPTTRILLLGLTPRGAGPDDPLRQAVGQANQLIQTCADASITYADVGGGLLDAHGVLSHTLSPDLLHFSGAGYQRIVPKLDPAIDRLEGAP